MFKDRRTEGKRLSNSIKIPSSRKIIEDTKFSINYNEFQPNSDNQEFDINKNFINYFP